MAEQLLISLDDAARQLSLSRRTIQSLVYSGQLPSCSIGRARRIAVADLEAFVDGLRNESDRGPGLLAVVGGGSGRPKSG